MARPRMQPDPEITRLYVEERLTAHEIAARVYMSQPTVLRRLERAGVERRPPGWRGSRRFAGEEPARESA